MRPLSYATVIGMSKGTPNISKYILEVYEINHWNEHWRSFFL